MSDKNSHYFDSAVELLAAVEKLVRKTDVVMDIGCGIVPINYFRPKLHLMVEPWKEYAEILVYRHSGDKSVIIVHTGALEALCLLADNSVDSVFLIDVIEHLEKEEGRQVILESERVAREQVVIFTPLGFMPQHMENGDADGWGLGGSAVQEHRSGWEPEDFSPAWSFYICKDFHSIDFKGDPLEQTYGAFYAICNLERTEVATPKKMPDFRTQLPSEVEVGRLQAELNKCRNEHRLEYDSLRLQYDAIVNSRSMRIVRGLKKILCSVGVERYR